MTNGRIKRPAYQWYPAQANSDEVFRLMTYEQQGVYRALLDHQWEEGSIPSDVVQIAALLPKIALERFRDIWPLISSKFRALGSDRLINGRLDAQRKSLDKFIRVQRANARKGVEKRRLEALQKSAMAQPSLAPTASSLSLSLSSSVPKNKEHVQAPEKAPSPAKEFLTWFQAEYKTRRGGAYFVSWDKHMPIVGRLLKLHAPDRLRKHAQLLLTTDEPWTETTDRGIEVLAGKINWLEDRLAAWEARKKAREPV